MKLNILIILIFLLSGCNNNNVVEHPEIDKFWKNYLDAIKQKNIDFLIDNSLDSIQCGDCAIEESNTIEYFNSRDIYHNHLDKFTEYIIVNNNNYSIYERNDTVRINYNLGNGNQIYTLIKTKNNYKFHGTFPVP